MRQRPTLLTTCCSAALLALLACNGKGEFTLTTGAPPVTGESPSTGSPQTPSPSTPNVPESPGEAPAPTPTPTPEPTPTPTPTPEPEPEPTPPPAPTYSRILWVSPSGSDSASGTESAPLRTVSRALTLIAPGEAIYLKTGTYAERLKLEERGGTASKPLTVKAAPGASPVVKPGASESALVDVRGAYWTVDGLTLDAAGTPTFAVLWRGAATHHGVLRNCVAKNGTAGAGLNVSEKASDILIERNTISHFDKGSSDSHGVIVQTTARNVVVRGNDIHHNSGDGVQCIGPEGGATVTGTPFDNLLVEDNELHENRENGADIKTCTRVTLRGNVIWGHKATSTSRGEGVVVHLSASDVTLEDNVFYGNGRAINIGGTRVNAPPTRITVQRNLIRDGLGGSEDGGGIRVDTSNTVKVLHNTVWNMPGACLTFGHGDTGASASLDVRNNIFAGCGLGVRAGSGRSGAVVDGNLYFSTSGAARFQLDGSERGFADWRSSSGLDRRSMEKSPAFVNIDTGDFRLGPTSPARNAGLGVGLTFCGGAPDLGAFESDCP
ncbi:right-handed parallel beta-helix repeat-containing protein [Myxococcus sp. K15C18031901]|uniref:right-handed parallel beta-helix repeat-containing protein n=1 Tax=Myxococcus dinghuensis TaxID=2906761 RepID=UPI0020A7F66E|nr:right-handed parallel beta-helix repeat-containing protein [Myxococcus dinghuensis]MCP3099717.1 right-handed parallel beta-helix repeat-containing protein [Myxococcus dinghuensis]